jgi:hypothetical protein
MVLQFFSIGNLLYCLFFILLWCQWFPGKNLTSQPSFTCSQFSIGIKFCHRCMVGVQSVGILTEDERGYHVRQPVKAMQIEG